VVITGSGKFGAQIMVKGSGIWLGSHVTPELASAAYERAAKHHFGEFARA
jgi:hypothetical protein